MLVLADGQALQNATTVERGIGRYVAEYASSIERHHPGRIDSWVLRPDLPVPDRPGAVVRHGRFRLQNDPDLRRPDIWHVLSPFESIMSSPETIWPAWARTNRTRLVVTLYDLIPLVYADHYLADRALRRAYHVRLQLIERADRVLAISQASAEDAVRLLGVRPSAITVVGTGVSDHFVPAPDPAAAAKRAMRRVRGLRPGYVMYTGGIDFRKNIDGLLLAYSKLPSELRRRHQLVIVCRMLASERRHLLDRARALGVERDLLLTGYVADQILLTLYQAAHLFVFPSLYEGFGLPVVEALSCGVPCIVGNNSSLKELVPDPRSQFDANSVDSIARALFTALSEPAAGPAPRGLILQHDHRWHVVAERSVAAYDATASRRGRGSPRPRVALISPMPPTPSGVADYSRALLEELSQQVAVDVFTEPSATRTAIPGVRWFTYAEFDVARAVHGPYAESLIAMGNSEYHVDTFEILRRAGGIVISHDASYTGLMGVLLDRNHPLVEPDSEEVVISLRAGKRPGRHSDHVAMEAPEYYSMNSLLTEPALRRARKILVHSRVGSMLVRSGLDPMSRAQVRIVPFGHTLQPPTPEAARDAIVSLGVVDRIKHSDLVCAAFIRLAHRHPELTFAVIGHAYDSHLRGELDDMVNAAGLDGRLIVTGHVTHADYRSWLGRARVAVQLRARSRGESSAAIAECLGAGVPVIASNVGAFADLADACVLIDEPATVDSLVAVVEQLLADPSGRLDLSNRGRAHAERNTFADAAHAVLRECGIVDPTGPAG